MNKVCQRQWIAFYVMHEDRQFPAVEHPVQIVFGQFTDESIYFTYNYKMFTDCEVVVQVDRQLYGWDSQWATHDYQRDLKGHLNWTVTRKKRNGEAGKKVMDL